MSLKKRIGIILLKITRWKIIGPEINGKVIFAVLPHTSYMDFFVGKMASLYLDFPIYFMIKKEVFIFPVGYLLKALGGIPIDRKNPIQSVINVINKLKKGKTFALVIAPEGTRELVKEWKPGFWYIAVKTNTPVVAVGLNYQSKTLYVAEPVYMTSNCEESFEKLRKIYRSMDLHAKYPEKFIF